MSANAYTLPKDWKDGHVSPIFKKGDKSSAENYRPVSLNAVACNTNMDSCKEDEGGNLDIVYLDFQKAFDTVPPQRLLH